MLMTRQSGSFSREAGISIVELLVGLAIGLIVISAGLFMLASFTNDTRRLMAETRLVQDLRAVSDLITRDLRRAGYKQSASAGVWTTGGTAVQSANAYADMHGDDCTNLGNLLPTTAGTSLAVSSICYFISNDLDNAVGAGERFGFRLDSSDGRIVASLGGEETVLSDPATMRVTDLVITPRFQLVNASDFCVPACTHTNCPRILVREFEVIVKGELPNDASINRVLRSNVRVRNDAYFGQCIL